MNSTFETISCHADKSISSHADKSKISIFFFLTLMMIGSQRLSTELRQILRDKSDNIFIRPRNDKLNSWRVYIKGPPDTPFQDKWFKLRIRCPRTYPMKAPKVRFVTKIFHPNIHFRTGEVCLDVLKTNWTPVWDLLSICRAIIILLSNPEPDSPLNCDAGNMLRAGDLLAYNSIARMYTIEHGKSSLRQN